MRLSRTLRIGNTHVKKKTFVILLAAISAALIGASNARFVVDPPPATPEPAAPQTPPVAPETTPAAIVHKRVHVLVNKKTEIGGMLIYEDENRIVLERDGKRLEFKKDEIIDAITLLDIAQPTQAVIYRRDGSAIQVLLVADDFNEVRYSIGSTQRSLPRAEVYRTALVRTFEERYQSMKNSIDPSDAARRLALCDWLFSERKYALAKTELTTLVADTKLPQAVALLSRVEAQLKLMPASESKKPSTKAGDSSDAQGAKRTNRLPTLFLTDAQVNLIRVYEIDFDRPPRVVIDPVDARAFLDDYASNPRVPADAPSRTALVEGDPMKLVRLAFDLKAREFYPKIRVVSEPEPLALFRRNVHDGWLIANCATSRCHGGPDAGRLFLSNENHTETAVRYTNLMNLLLGTSKDLPLINFADPNSSLLIQYALVADEAATAHPPVKGWKPVFGRKLNPEKLANTIAWIRSMYQPRPVYPIDYQPPDLRTPLPGSAADADEPSR